MAQNGCALADHILNNVIEADGRRENNNAPGVKAQHAMRRHPNAEEWEYVIQGVGIKRVGEDTFYLRAGDLAFVPRNAYHALENASDSETLVTIWGYCGASSLEEAGYFTPEDDQKSADRGP